MLRISKLIGWAAAAVLASTAAACGGGGGGSPAAASTTFVSGKVLSSTGTPLAGAVVSGQGQSVTTGSDGAYRLGAAGDNVVVLVKKTGFTTTAKDLPLVTGQTTQIDITLLADQVTTSFSASTAADIAVSGANLKILANAIQTSNGQNYTGTVNVAASYYSPDTPQGVQAFAGPYTGVDAGTQSPIISMGFMEVKLTDAAGNPLQLKAGSPATLTFPPSSNSGTATSVPLWFYDEAAKIWKREGTATRQADGTFQGTVAHFTVWNVDFYGQTATIAGCFKNAAGEPVANVGAITLFGTGWARYFSGSTTAGNFTIIGAPANMTLQLQSAVTPPAFSPIVIPALNVGETRRLACATAIPAATGTSSGVIVFTTPPGTVTLPAVTTTVPTGTTTLPSTTGTTASFAGNYTGTFSGSESGTFNVVIGANGVISGTAQSQTTGQSAVSGVLRSDGTLQLNTSFGTAGSADFIGTINSNFVISGTWTYRGGAVGGGTFIGQRVAASAPTVPPSTTTTVPTGTTTVPTSTTTVPTSTTTVPTATGTTVSFAGNYTGNISGTENYIFSINIPASGIITGSVGVAPNATAVGGFLRPDGVLQMNTLLMRINNSANTNGYAVFNGSIDSNFVLTGTWDYQGSEPGGGTFTGQRN